MCLEVIAVQHPDAPSRISAERLAEASRLAVSLRKANGVPCLHFSVTGGCSCDLLSDAADWNSELWSLEGAHLEPLSRAITALGAECGRFSFLAHWLDGKRPKRSESVSAAGLARLVRENQLGNNVLYAVGPDQSAATLR